MTRFMYLFQIKSDCYADINLGVFLLRGDNIVVFGETDDNKWEEQGINLKKISHVELQEKKAAEEERKRQQESGKSVDWDLE